MESRNGEGRNGAQYGIKVTAKTERHCARGSVCVCSCVCGAVEIGVPGVAVNSPGLLLALIQPHRVHDGKILKHLLCFY